VNDAVRGAKLSSRHKAMLKQSGIEASQVILPELLLPPGTVEKYEVRGLADDPLEGHREQSVAYTPITWDEVVNEPLSEPNSKLGSHNGKENAHVQ